MLKLEYYVKNARWGSNHLIFNTWEEYWKTLGYLSNPNVHRENNSRGNIKITYENNELDDAYTGTTRIHYYGNEARFSRELPSIYEISKSGRGNIKFRINRKEFGETLLHDLGFEIIDVGLRDDLILPPSQESILQRISSHHRFNRSAWDEGYSLGNL